MAPESLKSIEKRARMLYVEWSDLHSVLAQVKDVEGVARTWLTLYDVVADARAALETFKDKIVEGSEDPDGIDRHVDKARGRAYKKIDKVSEFLTDANDALEGMQIGVQTSKYGDTQGLLRALEGAIADFYALINKLDERIGYI